MLTVLLTISPFNLWNGLSWFSHLRQLLTRRWIHTLHYFPILPYTPQPRDSSSAFALFIRKPWYFLLFLPKYMSSFLPAKLFHHYYLPLLISDYPYIIIWNSTNYWSNRPFNTMKKFTKFLSKLSSRGINNFPCCGRHLPLAATCLHFKFLPPGSNGSAT